MNTPKITSAVQTPPHLLFQFLEEYKSKFKRLEYFISFLKNRRQVADDIEEMSSYWWRDPVSELPYNMRSLINNMGNKDWSSNPLSISIQELQDYSKLKLDFQTISSVLKRLITLETDRSEYRDFYKYYSSFVKEYPEALQELHDQAGPEESEMGKQASQSFQTYRTALDAVYRYIQLYFKFAVKIQALLVRREMQQKAYYEGTSDRKQRPPIKDFEVLFHATMSISAILREGFKTKEELGEEIPGLGGMQDKVISFTADIDIAKGITDAFRNVVRIAHGELSLEQVIQMAESEGLDTKEYQLDWLRWNYGVDRTLESLTFEAYRKYLWHSPTKYNPVFMSVRIEFFEKIKQEDIGIIASKIDMSQVTEYLVGEEEFRVPTSAILSVKRVLY